MNVFGKIEIHKYLNDPKYRDVVCQHHRLSIFICLLTMTKSPKLPKYVVCKECNKYPHDSKFPKCQSCAGIVCEICGKSGRLFGKKCGDCTGNPVKTCVDCGAEQRTKFSGNPSKFRCHDCYKPYEQRVATRDDVKYDDVEDNEWGDSEYDIQEPTLRNCSKCEIEQETLYDGPDFLCRKCLPLHKPTFAQVTKSVKLVTRMCDDCGVEQETQFVGNPFYCRSCFDKIHYSFNCYSCNKQITCSSLQEKKDLFDCIVTFDGKNVHLYVCQNCRDLQTELYGKISVQAAQNMIKNETLDDDQKLIVQIIDRYDLKYGDEIKSFSEVRDITIECPSLFASVDFDLHTWVFGSMLCSRNKFGETVFSRYFEIVKFSRPVRR